jgi:hypothetical protein
MIKLLSTQVVDIPDGEYEAKWSGYTLEINAGDKNVKTETIMGMRGINIRLKVRVIGGLVEKIIDEETNRPG